MAVDPGTMQQMLMQKLQQGPQQATGGGGNAGPQMVGNTATPAGLGAQVAQKIMLMKALQNSQQGQQQVAANGMLPGTQAQMAADPTMQALQQTPQLSMPPMPAAMPAPGQ